MKNNDNIIFFIPSIEGGGVEKNLLLIINHFSKNYNKLFLITCSHLNKDLPKNVEILTPKNKWFNRSRIIKNVLCSKILTTILYKKKNISVFSFQANIFAIIITKLRSKKIAIRLNSSPKIWSKNIFKIHLFKFFYSLADKIIVNSYEFKRDVKNIFNLKSNVIYNPLNKNEILKKSKKRVNNNFFLKKDNSLKILNIGRFTKQKNQILILKAINEIKDKFNLKLFILGRGIEEYNLRKYIKINNLKKYVKIIKYTNNPYPYMRNSDLFILSSIYEGLPNVLIESQLLNKPIISATCPSGPREILMNGKAGILFKNNDLESLVTKIRFYFKNKHKINQMVKTGKKNIERFNYDVNMRKYLKILRSIN